MTDNHEDEKPCLIKTGQGFSDLSTVKYKGRFLYSKYNPGEAVDSLIRKLDILPGTIVLANSPLLFYGLKNLSRKLPADCFIIFIECNADLLQFTVEHADTKMIDECLPLKNFALLDGNDFSGTDGLLRNLVNTGKYRRAISLDFSAGTTFARDLYSRIHSAAAEIINVFWKNRITLTRMGRMYNRNIFRNLKYLCRSQELNDVRHTVCRPVIVCGAGESLDYTFRTAEDNKEFMQKVFAKDFYIICADAALPFFSALNIPVDAVAAVECQNAILQAYVGQKKFLEDNNVTLFADLSSNPHVMEATGCRTIFFASRYGICSFLNSLENNDVIKSFIIPLGSVGLSAVIIALQLRQNENIPVYVTGLDFSFSAGRTHCRNAPQTKTRYYAENRINRPENYVSCYSENSFPVPSKNGGQMFSSPVMVSYAQNFVSYFSGAKNLFDAGICGIDLGLARKTDADICADRAIREDDIPDNIFRPENFISGNHSNIESFCRNEISALGTIRSLLTEGERSSCRNKKIPLTQQLQELIEPRDYLYIHFPDGHAFSMSEAFLKRVRAEIDFFMKWIPEI